MMCSVIHIVYEECEHWWHWLVTNEDHYAFSWEKVTGTFFFFFFCWQLFLSTWAYTWYKIYCCSRSWYTKEQMKHKSSKAYKHFIDNWTQEVLHKKINGFHFIEAKVRYSNMLHKLFPVRRVYTCSSLRHRPQYCTLCIEWRKWTRMLPSSVPVHRVIILTGNSVSYWLNMYADEEMHIILSWVNWHGTMGRRCGCIDDETVLFLSLWLYAVCVCVCVCACVGGGGMDGGGVKKGGGGVTLCVCIVCVSVCHC